ncbi:MAG: S8 family serine peptidase [Caldilineaceae bacterium]
MVITHRGGVVDRPINFDLFAPRSLNFNRPVYARSLTDLADAPNAITVGAIDILGSDLPETYSAEGPTNGPGGVAEGGILKPNLIAYTNVSTAGADRPFNGTSAATPHVAGAALLVKDAYPEWTPAALRDFVYSRARPLPADLNVSPGQVGYGRLDLGEAPSRLLGSEISIMAGRSNGDSTQFETIIAIVNATSITATANLTHPIPSGVTLTGSAAATLDPAPTVVNGAVTWQGDVPPDSVVEVRYSADGATMPEQPLRLRSTATLRDSDEVEIEISVFVNPLQVFLPLLTP